MTDRRFALILALLCAVVIAGVWTAVIAAGLAQ